MAKNSKNYLDLVPIRSGKLAFEQDEAGRVTVIIENKGLLNFLMQKIAKKPRFSRIILEGQGSFVWLCIDGKRTVYDIALLVGTEFGEAAEPIYSRLLSYMHTLETCGFIEMTNRSTA